MARPRNNEGRPCKHCGKTVFRFSARDALIELGRTLGKLERSQQAQAFYENVGRESRANIEAHSGSYKALLDLRYLALEMDGRCREASCFDRELADLRRILEREKLRRDKQVDDLKNDADRAPLGSETTYRHRIDGGGIDADWHPPESLT